MRRWRSPEELAEIGLSQSRVLMVNEAHDHLRRCIRTRRVGARMIGPAHAAGVRHLAMEAPTPDFAAAANRDRRLGSGGSYLAQPDFRELMTAALELGWSLVATKPMRRREMHRPRRLTGRPFGVDGVSRADCGWSRRTATSR